MIKEKQICEEIDISKWKHLRERAFEKYKGEDGYYASSTGCYRGLNKKYFTVSYIIPLLKGGQIQVDNLQLLAKWENTKKGEKISLDILEEQLKHDNNCKEDISVKQAVIDEILKLDGNNIAALGEMAGLEVDNSNYHGALEYCNRILNMDAYNEQALMIKSFATFEVKNYIENKECIEKLIEIKETPFRVMQLGNCYFIMNENDKAIYYYKKALKMDGNDECVTDLNYFIADAYYAKEEYEEALRYFKEVLKRDSEHLCALNDMGACLFKLKRFKEALGVFEKAIEIEPNQLACHKNIEIIKNKIKTV